MMEERSRERRNGTRSDHDARESLTGIVRAAFREARLDL